MSTSLIKRFENPDEVRTFERGKFEILRLGGMVIGRATYAPGWVWSRHVGSATGRMSCMVEHVGQVVSGHAKVKMDDGSEYDLLPAIAFIFRPATTAGSRATSPMFPCISWGPKTMPTRPFAAPAQSSGGP